MDANLMGHLMIEHNACAGLTTKQLAAGGKGWVKELVESVRCFTQAKKAAAETLEQFTDCPQVLDAANSAILLERAAFGAMKALLARLEDGHGID